MVNNVKAVHSEFTSPYQAIKPIAESDAAKSLQGIRLPDEALRSRQMHRLFQKL